MGIEQGAGEATHAKIELYDATVSYVL